MDQSGRYSTCRLFVVLFCVVGSATIPIRFGDSDRLPYFHQSVIDFHMYRFTNLRSVLHLGIRTHMMAGQHVHTNWQRLVVDNPQLELTRHDFVELRQYSMTNDNQIADERLLLAIGPGSDVWRTFGNVAFVCEDNNSGALLLGDFGEEDFVSQSCYPDSVIRIRTFDNLGYPIYSYTLGRLLSWNGDEDVIEIRFATVERMLLLHPQIIRSIFHEFPNIARGTTSITECTNNRMQLPDIQIAFQSDDDALPGKMIVLTPEDYTRFKLVDDPQNTSLDECDFLIGQTPYPDNRNLNVVEMNPLLIPGFNAYTAQNILLLCESLHYEE